MSEIKTFKRGDVELEVGSLDQDMEVEFFISTDCQNTYIWLTVEQVKELISHLETVLIDSKNIS